MGSGPAPSSPPPPTRPGAAGTWVWIRFRPRNHRIWPRRSSRSAWSISSTSSLSSSSGISSFWVSLPASLRNLSLLVGMVAMTCGGPSRQPRGPAAPSLPSGFCHSLTQFPSPRSLAHLPPSSTQCLDFFLIPWILQSQRDMEGNLGSWTRA